MISSASLKFLEINYYLSYPEGSLRRSRWNKGSDLLESKTKFFRIASELEPKWDKQIHKHNHM